MFKKILALVTVLALLTGTALAELSPSADDTPAIQPLPIDFSAGFVPDEAAFTEDGYQYASITVQMSRVWVDGARYNVAHVTIADPSQLRTALAADFGKSKTNKISTMARNNNAVVAIGGDYYVDRNNGYVVRQGVVYRTKLAKTLDILLIDSAGDFHLILSSNAEELRALLETLKAEGKSVVNVFNFGPALVVDGEIQQVSGYANFNPRGKEPRSAIGQIGPLEYIMVTVDGRDAAGSSGCSMQTLAAFMAEQGCVQAFNLDGGNSSLMVFHGANYSEKSFEAERSVSDIIYFATAIDPDAE